ncbi:monocarboxylate transporter 13-like isoform X2 [Mercenaria mercenaria]|nr:monocarboxylate transporter 13-like isoform X2 [Mercenaria mercenaria]XP_053403670.1 monocarboxylate transporter 13-like isoform X2 [Mercenaria mercenaria]
MYFSLGFLTGVGYGLIFIPAVVEVTMYFKKHRALACGIAVSGAGAGAFVFSPLIEHLLDAYAWRGTLLICSGLLLNCVPCSLIFRNKFVVEESKSSKRENNESNGYLDVTVEYVHSNTNTSNTPCKLCDETDNEIAEKIHRTEIVQVKSVVIDKKLDIETELQEASVTEKMLQDADYDYNKGIGNSFSGRETKKYSRCFCCEMPKLSLFHILRQNEMILFYCAQILFFLGFYFPFIGIPGMAIQCGIGGSKAVWIISTIGICTVIGRIVLGYVSDRPFMNSLFLYKVALLVAGISTTLVPLLSSYAALLLYAAAFGVSTAVLLSQTTVVLVEIIGMERMSDAMGLNNMFSGFGALLGPPTLGMLYDQTKSYTFPFITSGLSMAMGGILLFLMALCMK